MEREESAMTAEECLRRLVLAAKGENLKLRELARDIGSDSRKPLETLAHLWAYAGEPYRRKAETILNRLGAVSVPSLLALKPPAPAAKAGFEAARALLTTQRLLAARLLQLMDSRVPMPPVPSAGQTEEKELPSRECDEAYLLARRLLKGDDSERQRSQLRRVFLTMSEAERDAEIVRYRAGGSWQPLVEPED